MKLNTTQLSALRHALSDPDGRCHCDGSTGNALHDRGYVEEDTRDHTGRRFYITDAGRQRARRKADKLVKRDGQADDPTLMQDLPDPAP
jgi:hypothetical protein